MKITVKIIIAIVVLALLFKVLYPFILGLLGAYLFLKYTVPLIIIIIIILWARRMFKNK